MSSQQPKTDATPQDAAAGLLHRLVRSCCDFAARVRSGSAINRRAVEKPLVFVEIVPREIRDIVAKPGAVIGHRSDATNDLCGCKSAYDAIVKVEDIGSRLIHDVRAENIFFFFSESVESLRSFLFSFCDERSIPYHADDIYGPIYGEEDEGAYAPDGEPLAVVLCKLGEADKIKGLLGRKQEEEAEDCRGCRVSWDELQRLKGELREVNHSQPVIH